MRILCIGDVTGEGGVRLLSDKLWQFRKENRIDFCIVNAENAAFITGASPEIAERLLAAGADCLSGGNHTLRNRAAYTYLDDTEAMLRPINFGAEAPGHGYAILDAMGYRMLVISALGNVNMDPTLDNPYGHIDRVLEREAGRYDFSVLDIHAEATGEKKTLANAFSHKLTVFAGTHTHVKTADLCILETGCGYITDLGMCGVENSSLGVCFEDTEAMMRTHMPRKFSLAKGKISINGAVFTVDLEKRKTVEVRSIGITV